MDIVELKRLYLDEKLSTTDIAKKLKCSVSKVRYWLKKENCLRDRKTAHKLAVPKMGKHLLGKKREFTKKHKNNMKQSSVNRAEKMAKGFRVNTNGYIEFTRGKLKSKMLHIHIMECLKNRPLKHNEVVHHKDGNKLNNSVCNLELMSRAKHASIHGVENYKKRDINNKGQLQ